MCSMKSARSPVDNVRVFCRFRPLSAAERDFPLCVSFDGPKHLICKIAQSPGNATQQPSSSCGLVSDSSNLPNVGGSVVEQYRYAFSRVYEPDTTQKQLYDDVARPIVDDVMQGYNGTLLVYGQTGSGKTHTMFGSHSIFPESYSSSVFNMHDDGAGIVPRAVRQLFHAIHAAEDTAEFEIRAQFVEVYMERTRDLLNPSGGCLHVREDLSGFYVENCEMPYVANTEEVLQLVRAGLRHRVTATTARNDTSSRSHCVLNITVKRVNRVKHEAVLGKLLLVDLAGCEKVSKTLADGLQLAEAKLINKSLTALGHVIMCLAEKQAHVPYRDSKLTQILKDCLGGNSRTALIVCCSPSQLNSRETLSSLRFGARAQNVCNRAVVNRQLTVEELRSMFDLAKVEIQRLHRLLREKQSSMLLKDVVVSPDHAETMVRDTSEYMKRSSDDDNVEKSLQQEAHEQLSLRDMKVEVDRLREALRDAEYRADLLHTQSAMQVSLVEILQQECATWEEEYRTISRELYAHRRCAEHYRMLVQRTRDEEGPLPHQLTSYIEALRAIRGMMKKQSHTLTEGYRSLQQKYTNVSPLGSPSKKEFFGESLDVMMSSTVNGELSPIDMRSNSLQTSHHDSSISREDYSTLFDNHDQSGDNNTNNNDCDGDGDDGDGDGDEKKRCDILLSRMTVIMKEMEDLRKTNGSLTLELQLAHKKLAMRHTRIESLKFGFRKECAEKQTLQQTLEEERNRHRIEIQKARNDALHWRQCYDDLLNNCHIINRKNYTGRGGQRRDSTPTLETALSSLEQRFLPSSSLTGGRGIIVKAIRGGNHIRYDEDGKDD